jgi:hypothetical protein
LRLDTVSKCKRKRKRKRNGKRNRTGTGIGIGIGMEIGKKIYRGIPLRESLVASNVSPLACFATVSGFGVALAWWTTAWTDHFGFEIAGS